MSSDKGRNAQDPFTGGSNVVMQKDSSKGRPRHTGEGESLAGRNLKMGDKSERANPGSTKRGGDKTGTKGSKATKKKETEKVELATVKDKDILEADIREQPIYEPQTKETKAVYEEIQRLVAQKVGDQSPETLTDVTNELVALLRMDDLTPDEKKKEMSAIFPSDEVIFTKLSNLAKELKDYSIGIRRSKLDPTKPNIVALNLMDQEEAENDNQMQVEVQSEEDYQDEEVNDDASGKDHSRQGEGDVYQAIDLSEIDSTWLLRQLEPIFPDKTERINKEEEVLEALGNPGEIESQNKLVEIFDPVHFEFVQFIHEHRIEIFYLTKYARANTEEKQTLLNEMRSSERSRKLISSTKVLSSQLSSIVIESGPTLQGLEEENRKEQERFLNLTSNEDYARLAKTSLDLNQLEVSGPSRFTLNAPCKLPKGSYKQSFAGYEEVTIPSPEKPSKSATLKKISDLPDWTHPVFTGIKTLNPVQSSVYDCAFKSASNMLVCAPTGAGKTNIALLTILQMIGANMDEKGFVDKSKFKAVYIAPMKALVSEVVNTFTARLKSFGLTVKEMTGDMQLTRAEVDATQIIVATPEKWDIATRKAGDKYFLDFVSLLILDEVHLLQDSRGPVLEAIVSRAIRHSENTGTQIRLVGLSATLPNYRDAAAFLRVEENDGLFFFDGSFRPVPLEQQYVGITEQKGLRRMLLMKEILYKKVMERVGKQQTLVFVHSRRETAKTAKEIRDQAFAQDELAKLIRPESDSKKVLEAEAGNCSNVDLKELLPYGLAIHHAGLSREDRTLVEDLFADRQIQVLVSTATLAWGVNLPAKTVIIKGTQVYSPEQGKWIELSSQDLLQMLGRAGRPGLDVSGEGIIITGYDELKFYLSLANNQLPLESQFITQLADQMNAEIILGTITNLKQAVDWIGYTFLFVRMLKSPQVYGVSPDTSKQDRFLLQHRADLVHSAALLLDKHGLIKYDRRAGEFTPTTLGRISSHYYIKHASMAIYAEHLRPTLTLLDLFRIFSLSVEFKHLPVRDEEKPEVDKLLSSVPIPVRGSREDPTAKVNILLQAYIGRRKLDGYAINSDMVFITQSAARILRGLFEIFLKRGWASVAENCLRLCLMVDKRQWSCLSPLRQYANLAPKLLRRIENQEHLTWEHFFSMTPAQVGTILKSEKMGPDVHDLIHQFPRLELTAYVQPISRSTIKIELRVKSNFHWSDKISRRSEGFWLFVTDVDGEVLLYHEFFVIHRDTYKDEKVFDFSVPLLEPLHPQYFIKVISDKWLQCQSQIPISFKNLILPAKFPASMELQDIRPLNRESIEIDPIRKLLNKMKIPHLNTIQTQIFDTAVNTFDSYMICAPGGSGKSLIWMLSAARMFVEDTNKQAKVLVICPFKDLLTRRKKNLTQLAECFDRNLTVLTGQTQPDLQAIGSSDIILCTAEQWDNLSRRWRNRKATQDLRMVVFDHLHLLNEGFSAYEVVCSRVRLMFAETERKARFIGSGVSIANARDVAEWLGISSDKVYNFHPRARPLPLDTQISTYDQFEPSVRFYAMTRQLYQDLLKVSKKKQSIVFVSDKKAARLLAAHLSNYAQGNPKVFLPTERTESRQILEEASSAISDQYLKHFLQQGIGFVYEALPSAYSETVLRLFKIGSLGILILAHKLAWSVDVRAPTVAILDTKYYHEGRLVDYQLGELHEMLGKAGRPGVDSSSNCLLYCYTPTKDWLKKFLFEPVPVESHLPHYLGEHLNSEIASRSIESKQDCMDWLAWSFFYRRVQQNPNFYNLVGTSEVQKNEHLSEMIENAIDGLVQSECVYVDEETEGDQLECLNGGMIAAHYYIQVQTIGAFVKFVKENSKWKNLLEILSSAIEFEGLSLREGEEAQLKNIFTDIRMKPSKPVFSEVSLKINILLQASLDRKYLPPELRYDRDQVLPLALRLIQALVDCIGYNGWLKPALLTMNLSQMIFQGMWKQDSPLLQLPHFDSALISKCEKAGINTLGSIDLTLDDFLDMDDKQRNSLLAFTPDQMRDVAAVANRLPSVGIEANLLSADKDGFVELEVNLEREVPEEDPIPLASSPYYPEEKQEGWWVVAGDSEKNKLFGIKKVVIGRQQRVVLKFKAPEAGTYKIMVFLVCDCFIGCDQQSEPFTLDLTQ